MNSNLQGAELNYPEVEKQGFAIFKVVKHFCTYLLKARTKVIVPHPIVKALFVQKEMGEWRGNWITTLQEFDLEIKRRQFDDQELRTKCCKMVKNESAQNLFEPE